MRKFIFYVILSHSLLFCVESYSQKSDSSIIELTNKLGVSTTFSIPLERYGNNKIELSKSLSEQICSDLYNYKEFMFVIKLEDNAYMLVPIRKFREAVLKDGNHSVTLENGKTVEGKLIGQIRTNGKIYDMPSVSSIRIINNKPDVTQAAPPTKIWQLVPSKTNLPTFVITEPRFSFGYSDQYKSGGMYYTWVTGTFIEVTESFIIKVDNEEISANLSDFAKVSLISDQKGIAKIEITAPNGVKNNGSLILQKGDKNNIGYALITRLPEMADATLVLVMPNVSLTSK